MNYKSENIKSLWPHSQSTTVDMIWIEIILVLFLEFHKSYSIVKVFRNHMDYSGIYFCVHQNTIFDSLMENER